MATVTTCAKCSEKLRLPDEMRGQRVRCPQCSSIFEAANGSPPPPAPPSRPAGLDVPLNLSLDDLDPAGQQSGAPSQTKAVGAVELNQSRDANEPQSSAAPPPPELEPAPPSRPERPQRARDGDRDDMIRCPICQRSNDRDARRCFHCGERLSERPRSRYPDRDGYDDDYGYRRRRRDTEPHRGGMVLAMGIISLASILLTMGIGGTVIVGIICGIIGWGVGHADLRKMRNNQVDPGGEGRTRAGCVCSIIGTLVNLLLVLVCGGFIGFMISAESNAVKTTRSWGPPPTMPAVKQPNHWNPPAT